MPKITLTQTIVDNCSCPANRAKIDLFDLNTRGLQLEVRVSGTKTFYLRYLDARGKTRQMKLADSRDISLSQARSLADKSRAAVVMGRDPIAEKKALKQIPTFSEFVRDHYLPFVRVHKRSWRTDEGLLRNHILPKLGHLHLDEVKKIHIHTLHNERVTVDGAAPGSANRLLILVRYIFNLAIRWEIGNLTKNPSSGVATMKENNQKERFLSQDEARRLYEAIEESQSPMLRFIIPMLILTGARKREVLDARWEHFDFDNRRWFIPITKTGKPRHVPINDAVVTLLRRVKEQYQFGYVFANPETGKPFRSFFCSWNTARTKAGLQDVRIHDLRHTFASYLINGGRSLYEVQKILGHTQIKTTQRYAHLADETLLAASNTVAQNIGVSQWASTQATPVISNRFELVEPRVTLPGPSAV